MNDWKLGSAARGTISGWGYRESRFLPKPPGRARRALAAATSAVLTPVASHGSDSRTAIVATSTREDAPSSS